MHFKRIPSARWKSCT